MSAHSILLLAIGVFTVVCALLDVEWFMTHRKAQFFTNIFGRGGARVFYVILGITLALGGLLIRG